MLLHLLILSDIIVILNVPLVSYLGVRLMKSLFVPPLVVLAVVLLPVAVLANQYVFSDKPASEVITFYEMPVYSMPGSAVVSEIVRLGEERLVIPIPHTVKKPSETPIIVPEPLGLVPFLQIQDRVLAEERTATASTDVVRAQMGVENLRDILGTAPPLPRGPVEEGTIDSKFLAHPDSSNSELNALGGLLTSGNSDQPTSPGQALGMQQSDPLGYGVLVFATIVTTLGLIYMAFVAFDYRQRWMQSLTAQNDRYIVGGTFDTDMEGTYGGSVSFSDNFGFSEGFGLARRSI